MKQEFDWDRFKNKNKICVIFDKKESAIDFFKQKNKHTKQQDCNNIYVDFLDEWFPLAYYNDGTFKSIYSVNFKKDEAFEWSNYMEEKIFTKADLQNGMVVETCEPCLRFVLGEYLITKDSYISLNKYNDDLLYDGIKCFDIKRVFKLKNIMTLEMLQNTLGLPNEDHLELIYGDKIISKSDAEKLLEELTSEKYEIR